MSCKFSVSSLLQIHPFIRSLMKELEPVRSPSVIDPSLIFHSSNHHVLPLLGSGRTFPQRISWKCDVPEGTVQSSVFRSADLELRKLLCCFRVTFN